MKRLLCVSVVFLSTGLAGISGCDSHNKNGVEVSVKGGGPFPAYLAGTWKCEKEELEIDFKADGTISAAALPMGKRKLQPGKTLDVNEGPQYKAVFEPGIWNVRYEPVERVLSVDLPLDHFRVENELGVIEGKSRDLFSGPVSQDGLVWNADWYCFPEYYVTDSNNINIKHFQLPIDANDNPISTLIFRKVTDQHKTGVDSNTPAG